MLNYHDYEKAVYDALLAKRNTDSRYNFSVRRKAGQGAERDYFIGTSNSNYFGTTFWRISAGYPGSSGDLIDVFFFYVGESSYGYYIEFNQTKEPPNQQNESALELVESLEPLVKKAFGLILESKPENKAIYYKTKSGKESYSSIDEMIKDVFRDVEKLLPIVNQEIEKIKSKNPDFVAHQITDDEFDKMQSSLKKRLERYAQHKESKDNLTSSVESKESKESNIPLNQILFGPPGTGKTYNTINKALEILAIDISEMSRNEITNEFRVKIKQDQIVFTTFHQSMSYEEFIEGIKPIEPEKEGDNIIYRVEPGLFKKLCIEASFDFARRSSKSSETAEVLSFSAIYDKFIDVVEEEMLKGKPYNLQTKSGGAVIIESITAQRNIQIKHQNGTRSYTVSKSRLTKLNSEIVNLDEVNNINDEFREIIGGSNSSAYWSVLNAINKFKSKAGHTPATQNLSFEDKVDVVDKMTHEDYQSNEANNYVLIIDEINRGNVSQIFGELITLLEKDKRLGKGEALKTKLPYSKESFGIPPNLYVIGTMNTADRSVEALDTALRRRFSFTEMPPQPELINPKEMILRLWNKEEYSDVLNWDDAEFRKEADELYELLGIDPVFERDFHSEIDENEELEAWTKEDLKDLNEELFIGVNLEDILRTINNRIEVLLDKDHLIGHSFFMKVGNIEDLKAAFSKEILPLLQEYFFGDYGKISLVLGEGFCKGTNVSDTNHKGLFAKVSSGYDDSIYSEKIIHTIFDPQEMTNEDFLNAIQMLLNQ